MDALTLFIILAIFFVIAWYHREEQRKENIGIPYFGPIFCDTFWSMVERLPEGKNLTDWLDSKVKDHEEELRREIRRKQLENRSIREEDPKSKNAKPLSKDYATVEGSLKESEAESNLELSTLSTNSKRKRRGSGSKSSKSKKEKKHRRKKSSNGSKKPSKV
ncbi:hypothetical protein M3Y96_01027100 [Aphelenchoides besseyi]|nr:hypothetical protein M3Y96_01027100 [Aphelenchoides besseyi]